MATRSCLMRTRMLAVLNVYTRWLTHLRPTRAHACALSHLRAPARDVFSRTCALRILSPPDGVPTRVCDRLHGAQVAEPFKETTFTATWEGDAKIQESSASSSFDWVVMRRPEEQRDFELDLASSAGATTTIRGTGSSFTHTFNELGYHHVEVSLDGTRLTESGLWVRYVRREIRAVDEEDREALLAAFDVLLNTDDETGVMLYGSNYKSYQRLSTEHNNFAADWECDRLHDGMGFVPGHFSVGRLMEASLQSVTPGVALPYWEYTIDVEHIIENHNGNFFQWRYIPALSNRWFGATDKVNAQGQMVRQCSACDIRLRCRNRCHRHPLTTRSSVAWH
mmetsp:Transcript_99072/g.283451  ORF Transcript_99072/g.283451 Transcript_99072/m.283451 type:complete len:337 (+) Transcript_99072:2043-3053(+)